MSLASSNILPFTNLYVIVSSATSNHREIDRLAIVCSNYLKKNEMFCCWELEYFDHFLLSIKKKNVGLLGSDPVNVVIDQKEECCNSQYGFYQEGRRLFISVESGQIHLWMLKNVLSNVRRRFDLFSWCWHRGPWPRRFVGRLWGFQKQRLPRPDPLIVSLF